jgi:hypothetical protein
MSASCAHGVPAHSIPPRPDYILAGVQVGDEVQVTTKTGERKTFIVQSVGPDLISGPEQSYAFSNIKELTKYSWARPAHPCGQKKPVGCDIPAVVQVFNDYADQLADKFHPACVTHDFCYGHGLATYGASRDECDAIFYEDMKKECLGFAGLGVIDMKEFATCQLVANQIYDIVQKFGEKYYLSAESTVCDYRLTQ